MKRKRNILVLILSSLFICIALMACSRQRDQKEAGLKIVTSFYPIYSMVKEIAGDVNDVRMIQTRNGIHSFEPSANDVAAIYDADVFVYHSRTLESWTGALAPNLQESKVKEIEASQGMSLEKVAGLEDMEVGNGIDEKILYDPHTWLDPEKVAEEAQLIAQQLSELDPDHKELYQKNADKLSQEAQNLTKRYQPIFEKAKQKTFVTQHTAFSYLAKRFGLKQLGIAGISPEQEPSPRQLVEVEEFVKQYQIKTIFVESNVSTKVAETVAKSTGVELKTLNPLEADPENEQSYLENLEKTIAILAKELTK
ncbi:MULTISPECIES: metal ABC transporter solute-binding protein, Zn/Mn family [unclassified Streptococcus]|uniref:metal ABC transporter solute-binding protein, Zn/Mn family n=1 Tax=unclassified Streptococcus TaxID=2608887 RepID=UPI0010723425|nr:MULTISPECIES: zinc ABC transporter substrate-binding protein [unclassified Streptococcus]MBF0787790.1 zinc ABC transporter substrate-binding protein [Streptococcus sp. 19428wC2_LYSM12]MCQ9212764.1 zinc ABC transporter substrate-binding protein [Streptococcus sp. B01]MCQ9214105.1 zinc ABC transporter substrate-binding protein [Streptococcus sp. O1]TFV05186.1 adhesion protein [Streptococcus sp. LYSM12]